MDLLASSYKHKDLSSVPQHSHKNPSMGFLLVITVLGRWRQAGARASIVQLAISRSVKRLYIKKQGG